MPSSFRAARYRPGVVPDSLLNACENEDWPAPDHRRPSCGGAGALEVRKEGGGFALDGWAAYDAA
ncbi:hypothetical protein AB0L26_23870 [Streptomyces nondiastaticus]|uniref:hypothetical protein n=1 Tax=Streptomyces nondiastaticus TaxID=3154512 RepID=UPI00343D3EC3